MWDKWSIKTPLITAGGALAGFFVGGPAGAVIGGAVAGGGRWGTNKLGKKVAHANIDTTKGEEAFQINQD